MKTGAFPVLFLSALLTAGAASVPTFAPADLVLGQADFTSASLPAPPTAASVDEPSAVVVHAATGKVFVADTGNNRVLRFANAAALRNGANAELVFGQADFSTNGAPSPPTDKSLDSPTGLWIEPSGRLWVADADNHRVVMYPNAPAVQTNAPAATRVFGQPGFITEDILIPPAAASMSSPQGVCVDSAGRLWVADQGNNRVLRFGTVSPNVAAADKANGADADGVLGQQQFNTSTAGSGNQQLSDPVGVTVDPTGTLWIADRANNRVLGFPSAGTVSNGTNAARILGQPDFNGSVSPGTSASKFTGPAGVFADNANNLWVLDQGNNRALRFASLASIENGKPATAVIGQAGFMDNVTALNSRRLDQPFLGIFVESNGRLWLSDLNHHRVLRFGQIDDQAPTVLIKGKRKVLTTKSRLVVRGTASDDVGVTLVTVKIGKKKPTPAQGTVSWKKTVRLKPGRTVIKALAFDATGKSSLPARLVITRKAIGTGTSGK